MTSERYLTVAEVAEQLRVTTPTVWRWLRTGQLPGSRLPGGWRIRASDVEAFVRQQRGPREPRE